MNGVRNEISRSRNKIVQECVCLQEVQDKEKGSYDEGHGREDFLQKMREQGIKASQEEVILSFDFMA